MYKVRITACDFEKDNFFKVLYDYLGDIFTETGF